MTLRAVAWMVATSVVLQAQQPTQDIRDFVRQQFIHGVPYEAAVRYPTESEVPLLEMLKAQPDHRWWANAAQTLGFIGDKRAIDGLLQFVRAGEGKLDRDEYNAKTTAIVALGTLLNKGMDTAAFGFLRQGLNPSAWTGTVRWQSPFAENVNERNDQLALAAVRALGVSGRLEAETALRDLRGRATLFRPQIQSSATASIDEALQANAQVRNSGLKAYFTRF